MSDAHTHKVECEMQQDLNRTPEWHVMVWHSQLGLHVVVKLCMEFAVLGKGV
jgi:hypothetical protein